MERQVKTTNKIGLLCTGLLLGLFILQAKAIDVEEDPLKSQILRGIELTIDNQFLQAMAIYQGFIQTYPDHPIGYFYAGALVQAQMLDSEDYSQSAKFYAFLDKALLIADSLNLLNQSGPWILFYQGNAFLYRSFMKSKQKKWIAAYRDAVKGVRCLEEAIELEPELYDALLGIGSFKYWKSARSKFLLWLPFIKDEREKGISLIQSSIKKGLFVRWVARDQLCWVLMDRRQYRDAFNLALENYHSFPRSRFFKWTLVEVARKAGEMDFAAKLYSELLAEIRGLPENNHYNELECLVRLAEIETQRKNWHQAWVHSDEALRLKISPEIRKRAKKKRNRALKIRKMAQEILRQNKN